MSNQEEMLQITRIFGQQIINLIQNIEIARGFTYGEGVSIIMQLQQCSVDAAKRQQAADEVQKLKLVEETDN